MKRIKKGTAQRTAPHTHTYLNRIENTCLILFMAFLILFFDGYYFGIEAVEYIGLGIGIAVSIIVCILNTQEDD